MATTTVGVRELKAQAPRLVQRAAEGERVVITRYGKPLAVLGPASEMSEAAASSRLAAWERERRAFEALLPGLMRKHAGQYVAIYRGRVAGRDQSHEKLYQRVWKKLRGAVFFVGRVGGPADTVQMPGFKVR